MTYELWDTESRNRIAEYETEDAALVDVRYALEQHGESYVASLALGLEAPDGQSRTVAVGPELVTYAQVRGRCGRDARPAKPQSAGRRPAASPWKSKS